MEASVYVGSLKVSCCRVHVSYGNIDRLGGRIMENQMQRKMEHEVESTLNPKLLNPKPFVAEVRSEIDQREAVRWRWSPVQLEVVSHEHVGLQGLGFPRPRYEGVIQ